MAGKPERNHSIQTQQQALYLELRQHLDNLQKDNLAKQILLLTRERRLRDGVVRRLNITPRSLLVVVVYQVRGVVHLVAGYSRRKGEPSREQRRAIRAALGRLRAGA